MSAVPGSPFLDALAQKASRLERCVQRARDERGLIDAQQATALQHMVGFRNIAVHEYESLNMSIVQSIITTDIDCLPRLAGAVLSRYQEIQT